MKRPSSKSVAMKKVAKPKTKAAPKKKPAGQHGGKGLLKKPAKAVPEAEKLAEEGEEEEVFSDDEVVNPKVTAKNLKTHQQLLDAKLCSAKEVDKALSKLPPNEAQVLWKKFEKQRQLAGADGTYKDVTKGLGSQEKKHQLLRSFILDKGSIGKNYKTAMLAFESTEEKGGEVKFNTWKQQVDKYGKNEAVARLKAGTMKFRKSPTDPRFFEFLDSTEYHKWSQTKKRRTEYSTDKHKAIKDDWLSMENLSVEDIGDSSFGLSGTLDDMEVEPELKDFFQKQLAIKDDEVEPKKEENKTDKDKKEDKKPKWEEMSQVSKTDTKDSLLKKLLAFKTELCKDEATLQEAKLEAKGKSSNKDDLKILQSALTALQTSQKKIEKAISAGCKKEAAKEALIDSSAALEKGKKCKKLFGPTKKE